MILNDSKCFNIIRVTKGTSVDYRDNDIKPQKWQYFFCAHVRECDNVPASNVHALPALPSLYLLLVNLLLQDFAGKQCLFLGNNPPQIDQTTSLFAQTIEKNS